LPLLLTGWNRETNTYQDGDDVFVHSIRKIKCKNSKI